MHPAHNLFDLITASVFLFSGSVLAFKMWQRANWHVVLRHARQVPAITGRLVRRLTPAIHVTSYAIVCVVLMLPVAEFGLRAYFRRWGSEDDRIRYVYSEERIKSLESQFIAKPFVGFAPSPDFPGHNSLGYRGPEIVQPKPEGTYRIVALGGSTTYGFGIIEDDKTWPAQLQRVLRDEYDYPQVEVINAGVQLYTTWETLVNFEFRVLDLDPDLIIVYHATNDITARLVDPTHYDGLYSARGTWNTGDLHLGPSTLARYVGIRMGWLDDPLKLESHFVLDEEIMQCDMWAERQCGDYSTEELMALNPPIYFERNLRNLAALAAANDVQVMFSSWAYFPDTVRVTNIYLFPWRRAEVAKLNAIMQQVADDTGMAFYDLAANLPYNRNYWEGDGYHQSALGAEQQARQYAAFIAQQGWLN